MPSPVITAGSVESIQARSVADRTDDNEKWLIPGAHDRCFPPGLRLLKAQDAVIFPGEAG